jgi:hypothetical protein
MATYALYTLVIYIFNNYSKQGDGIKTEMQFFKKFFQILGDFDWDKHLITIYGPIRIQNLYDKLRDECNFDLSQLALNERMEYFGYKTQ